MSSVRKPGETRMPRIGLVLGAGGATGHAFHAGVLAALGDATGWDARDAEVIVGTSAGSVVGAMLRARLSSSDLAARVADAPLSAAGQRLVARVDAVRVQQPPIPSRPGRGGEGGSRAMSEPAAFARAALPPVERAARRAHGRGAARRSRPDRARRGPLASRSSTNGPSDALWINAVRPRVRQAGDVRT